jgi:hypothetical protein
MNYISILHYLRHKLNKTLQHHSSIKLNRTYSIDGLCVGHTQVFPDVEGKRRVYPILGPLPFTLL